MNLYFRLIYVLLKTLFAPKIQALSESNLYFRALPSDCDINLHITNSRYLSFMDLGRTYLIAQLHLLPQLYKRRWAPVIQATELTYLRPIMLGQSFKLITQIVCWDEKYFYMEQRFVVKGQLCTKATVKGLFMGGKKKIPTAEIVKLFNPDVISPVKPAFIEAWQEMLEKKKLG